ncbi:MAG: TrkA family potassium uptake protein [Gemmatimonadota bacterium]
MKIVVIGASSEAVMMIRLIIERGHEVILIDQDRDRIDELSDELDCAFLHGDGTQPSILNEADPEGTDVLFCLADHDQANILASLVGRSLGFDRIITSIRDPVFEELCTELDLEHTIVPARTISRYLADLVEGVDVLELRTVIKGEARFFSFTAGKAEAGPVDDLELPSGAKVICVYREDEFVLVDPDDRIEQDDRVVILTYSHNLSDLHDRWQPKTANDSES